MQANLYATFRLLAGAKAIPLNLPQGTTIYQAIQAILTLHPVLRPHWVDETGAVHAHVHIFINGEDTQNLPLGLETPLEENATLDFFPPVGGGSGGSH